MICALLASAAQAAELGEPRVSSFIGQPLVADIELTMLEDAATPVGVRLASANVYRGANIGMPAVLSTLNLSVMRRDGRQFLHVTSTGEVQSNPLHLYLELSDGAQRTVRLASLWLSPDPHPAPPPAPALPVVAPAPPVAVKAAVVEPARVDKPAPAPVRPKPAVAAAPRKAAPPAPEPEAAPAPVAGACAAPVQPAQDACAALGVKNVMLHEQLGQLEGKVKLLQVSMGAAPAAAKPPARPIRPKKKQPEPIQPETGTPWLLVGGAVFGVLALLLGLLVAMRRRKKPKIKPMPKGRLLDRLRPQPTPAAKPVEEGAHESSTQD